MTNIFNRINDLKDYANYIAIGFCIIGIIFAIIMILVMSFYNTTKDKKLIPKTLGTPERNIHDLKTAFDSLYVEKIPIISDFFADILKDLNLLKTGPIIASFFKIMRILKKSTFEKNWKYSIPWYMVIGPRSSGKSVLLDGLQFMNLPGEEKTHEDVWRIFDNTILFEVPSNTFFTEAIEFWNFLCKVFIYFRPKRPIDGIILTISADAIIENSIELSNIARETAYKISSAQNLMNMKLPVYIVITNADKIKCFSDFCSELSLAERNQILGWSVENDHDKQLPANWLDLFENAIHTGFRKAALSFASKKKISETLNNAIFTPTSVEQILPGINAYITAMTKSKDKALSLFIRGIYFSAISHDKISSVPNVQTSVLNPSNTNTGLIEKHSVPNNVCFIEDLFTDKILAECNLAIPLKDNKYHMDKISLIKCGLLMTFSIAWTTGWYHNTKIISREIKSTDTILKNAVTLMKRINVIETEIRDKSDQQIMNNEIRRMLQLLSNIKKQNLYSLFVPASWFSDLSDKISSSIGIIFDSCATRAIFLDLNLSAKEIGINAFNATRKAPTINKYNPLDIASLPTFITLKNYLNEIQKLEKLEGEYNRLRQLEDADALNDITKEIFQETFAVVNILNNRPINSKFIAPKFDLSEFREQIYINLKTLFNNFLANIFDQTIERIFIKLSEDINKFAATTQAPKEIYSAESLCELNAKIIKIIEIIKSKEFSWINESKFSPNSVYSKIIDTIEDSKILGPNIAKEIVSTADNEFYKFKDRLRNYATVFTGPFFDTSFKTPSKGLATFSKELNTIVQAAFTIKVAPKDLVLQVPSDQNLNWDITAIKEAISLIDKIEEFERNKIKIFRPQFQSIYSDAIRKMIYQPVISILARAQNLEDTPSTATTSAIESLLKRHAYNLKDLSKYLSKIILFLDTQENKGAGYCGFQELIISQAADLLKAADSLFELETPYSANHDLFTDWKGNISSDLSASDQNSVKKYLSSQFLRVKFLAKEIAWPAISILSLDVFGNRIPFSSEIQKWTDIINQVDEFEASKPGSSIAALESFITGIVSSKSIDDISNDAAIAEISNQTGDYFTNQRSKLAKALLNKANTVSTQKAHVSYNTIANYFNEHIAPKFPFGQSNEDLQLNTIEEFIKLYSSVDLSALKQSVPPTAASFIESLPQIIKFLKLWLTHSKTTDQSNAAIAFKLETRVNKNNETYGSIILERSVLINGFNIEDNNDLLVFHNGDNIEVKFPFIKSSKVDLIPSNDINLQIDDRTAIFSYTGNWSLFALVANHKAFDVPGIPSTGVILKFDIPVSDEQSNEDTATAFMKITPLMRSSSGNWQAFDIPAFPNHAPTIQNDF